MNTLVRRAARATTSSSATFAAPWQRAAYRPAFAAAEFYPARVASARAAGALGGAEAGFSGPSARGLHGGFHGGFHGGLHGGLRGFHVMMMARSPPSRAPGAALVAPAPLLGGVGSLGGVRFSSVLKKRRKKMRKHKLRKLRRKLRRSTKTR
jgi:hypothetical protein